MAAGNPMDMSKLSDAELEAIASSKTGPQEDVKKQVSAMTDKELEDIVAQNPYVAQEKTKSESPLVDYIVKAGKLIDSYTGAPGRAAIGAAEDAKNPISAFANQWGEDPDKAPTGKQIAIKAGVPDRTELLRSSEEQQAFDEKFNPGLAASRKQIGKPWEDVRSLSPAEAAGLGLDLAIDPTLAVPVGTVARLGAKGIGATAKGAVSGAKLIARATGRGIEAAGRALGVADEAAAITQSTKGAVEATGKVISNLLNPTISKDFGKLKEIALKNGIDPSELPESIEFGPDSFVSRASRQRAEGVLGQQHLEKFNDSLRKVQGAFETKISKLSNGAPTGKFETGQAIRESFDNAVDTFFDRLDWTHNDIVNSVPGLKLTDEAANKLATHLDELENYGAKLSEIGITAAQRTQGKQLVDAVHAIRMTDGSYKEIVKSLRLIGDAAFKTKNIFADIPPDIARLRKLYGNVSEALVETSRTHLGDDIADALVANNKQISEFFGDKSTLGKLIGNREMSAERLFDALITNGDVNKIEKLKKYLDPETLAQVKGALIENLIKRDPDGSFTFGSLHSALRNRREVVSRLFTPDEAREVAEIIYLGDSFGPAILSSSGTGASNVFSNFGQNVKSAVANDGLIEAVKSRARKKTTSGGLTLDIETIPKKTTEAAGPSRPLLGPEALTKPEAAAVGAKVLSTNQENIEREPNAKLQIMLKRIKQQGR